MSTDAGTATEPPKNRNCRKCGKSVFVGFMRHVGNGEFEHRSERALECTGFERHEDGPTATELRREYVFQKHGKGYYR